MDMWKPIFFCIGVAVFVTFLFNNYPLQNKNKCAEIKIPRHISLIVSKSVAYPGLDKVCAYDRKRGSPLLLWCRDGIEGLSVDNLIKTEWMDEDGNLYDRVTVVFKHTT